MKLILASKVLFRFLPEHQTHNIILLSEGGEGKSIKARNQLCTKMILLPCVSKRRSVRLKPDSARTISSCRSCGA